jgi:hypothetical protein
VDLRARAINGFSRLIGRSLDDGEIRLLLADSHGYTEQQANKIASYYDRMMGGFFRCVADNYMFGDVDDIYQSFGFTVEQNYPGASATFLHFARCYWTFKLMQDDFRREFSGTGLGFLFSKLESQLGAVFFPMPGIRPPRFLRKRLQKQLLMEHGAPFNIKDFILGNPYLK